MIRVPRPATVAQPSSILVREIAGLAELRAIEGLQEEIWGFDEREITPLSHLVAVQAVGGQLIGAFDRETLIGFVYGFAGIEHGRLIHHSHMLAVKPEYRNFNVGYRLKLAQRERVLAQGIPRITWTFDPLQSLNAYFNLSKLGGVGTAYIVNFYGEETSSLLHRLGTDRLWLAWQLDSRRTLDRLQGNSRAEPLEGKEPPLITVAADGSPAALELREGLAGEEALIEVPVDINTLQRLDREKAVAWREATRRAFGAAFDAGFLVMDFFRRTRGAQSVGVYLLHRGRNLEDSVG